MCLVFQHFVVRLAKAAPLPWPWILPINRSRVPPFPALLLLHLLTSPLLPPSSQTHPAPLSQAGHLESGLGVESSKRPPLGPLEGEGQTFASLRAYVLLFACF